MRVPRLGFQDYADIKTRMPLCDIIDKGDKYEVLLEVPGIDKEKIKINAKQNSVIVEGALLHNYENRYYDMKFCQEQIANIASLPYYGFIFLIKIYENHSYATKQ